jgi:Flp pilus assembly protein TadG
MGVDSKVEGQIMSRRASAQGERGFTLLTAGVCLIAMVGMLGLAADVGRMYIVRNEIQAYVDAATLTATLELDGTAAGIVRASNTVATSTNRWNMGTLPFAGTQTDFATAANGPWASNPGAANGYRFVRVRATATLPLYFIPAVSSTNSSTLNATAVAGQVLKTSFPEGALPFSPFAHNHGQPDWGFAPGQRYTLRWGSNPKVGVNVCPGDDAEPWVAHAKAGGASERGYIEENSSAIIRAAIEENYQTRPITVGEAVMMTGGNKQTQRDSLITRVNQDTDPTSTTYAQYKAADAGNGRRLVLVPVNTGHPDNIVLGFNLFFLLDPSEYPHGGNKPFCAEYVGPFVQGSRHQGAGGPGAYVVRLVQ